MFETQIANGMRWLDAELPAWLQIIDLDKLDLSSTCRCILGQAFGQWELAPPSETMTEDDWWNWSDQHGFSLDENKCEGGYDAWKSLTAEWIAAIRHRHAKVEPARATRPAAGMALTAICLR